MLEEGNLQSIKVLLNTLKHHRRGRLRVSFLGWLQRQDENTGRCLNLP